MDKKKLIITIVLVIIVTSIVVIITKKPASSINNKGKESISIRPNEVNSITLEEYSNDTFKMKKPVGWNVESAGAGVYYAIRVYDTKDNNNQVFLMIKMQPLLKSEKAKKTWIDYANLSNNSSYKVFSEAVVLSNPTTEGFYKKFGDITKYMNKIEPTLSNFKFPTFNDFEKIEEFESGGSMKNVAKDSKILRATFNGENSAKGEGMFMASIVNFGDNFVNGTDILYYMVYDIVSITSAKDKFIDYKDVLLQSANSIEFSDAYVKKTIDDGNAQTKKALELNASIQRAFDSYMSAWENRQKSYDIMSQKQSDAI